MLSRAVLFDRVGMRPLVSRGPTAAEVRAHLAKRRVMRREVVPHPVPRWVHRGPIRRRGPVAVSEGDLRAFFDETRTVLRSPMGAFIDAVHEGVALVRNPFRAEELAAARADAIMPSGETFWTVHRRAWGALAKVDTATREVLAAAYTRTDWPALVERHYDAVTADVLAQALGRELIGVALLTATARGGAKVDGDRDEGAWLVRLARLGDLTTLDAVRADAKALLARAKRAVLGGNDSAGTGRH